MENYFFDFDGTLADSRDTAILSTQAAFHTLGLEIPEKEMIRYYMGVPIEVSFKEMAAPHHFSTEEFETLLTHFRQFYQTFEDENLRLFDGIKAVLKQLNQEKKRLFVVSSKHALPLRRNLITLGIFDYFERIIGSDQVKNYKPAPDGILELLSRNQLSTTDSIMIGDAIFDIQMGKAAGVKTCAVTWGAHEKEALKAQHPDYLVNQVSELLSL